MCVEPGAARGLFDAACPLAVPRDTGMSVLLTSPAYFLALPILGAFGRSRLVTGALIAVVAIALFDLMHFSQGWVQFGYRFSNDAAPFALPLVALGFERLAVRRRYGMLLGMTLVVLSLAINLWGVLWSRRARMVIADPAGGLVGRRRSSRSSRPGWRCCPAWRSGTPASCRPSRP